MSHQGGAKIDNNNGNTSTPYELLFQIHLKYSVELFRLSVCAWQTSYFSLCLVLIQYWVLSNANRSCTWSCTWTPYNVQQFINTPCLPLRTKYILIYRRAYAHYLIYLCAYTHIIMYTKYHIQLCSWTPYHVQLCINTLAATEKHMLTHIHIHICAYEHIVIYQTYMHTSHIQKCIYRQSCIHRAYRHIHSNAKTNPGSWHRYNHSGTSEL